jgi:AcrR family transcriptional regulator
MGKAAERRKELREALVRAAEKTIRRKGLAGLKARDLAREAGCALGAIYNVFPDLDALILAVNARTLAAFQRHLAKVGLEQGTGSSEDVESNTDRIVRLAAAYVDFAAANQWRWRALFEHRMGGTRNIPDWYIEAQKPLFALVEEPLRELQPGLDTEQVTLLARNIFAAIHGVVDLGLNQKLAVMPAAVLQGQVSQIARALAVGLLGSGLGGHPAGRGNAGRRTSEPVGR